MQPARRRSPPETLIRPPPLPSGSLTTSIPKARSMRSVWSRVASRSITSAPPSACRPASSTADFTCAEATGER